MTASDPPNPDQTCFSSASAKIVGANSRWRILCCLLVLGTYGVARSFAYASRKPLWLDEILTQLVSRQASASAILKILKEGWEGNPPPFYLIERSAALLIPNELLGFRLLSIFGFVWILLMLYAFVKRQSGSIAALTSVSLLFITPLFTNYAVEARPYTLMTACIVTALVCYQRAPAAPWVIGLFLGLFLALSMHYYAVFAFLPFFLAELTVFFATKKLRISVWLALFMALIPLAVFWPLLVHVRQLFGAHFWAQPALNGISAIYAKFFRVESAWGTALGGITALAMVVTLFDGSLQRERSSSASAFPAHERVLVFGLIVLPIVGYIVAKLTHGPLVERYFLPAILGILAAVGYLLGRIKPTGVVLAGTIVLFAIASQELGFWISFRQLKSTAGEVSQVTDLANRSHYADLPIVISDAGVCVVLMHYGGPELRRRIVALPDPADAVTYIGTDTADRIVAGLEPYMSGAVQEFTPFAAAHPVFLLFSNGSDYDWWPKRLVHDGDRLQPLVVDGHAAMYLVELKTQNAAAN